MLRAKKFLVAAFLLASTVSSAWGQEQIPWITDLRLARQMAEQQQRVVLLHFWSESCPPCRLLEQNVFNQPELIRVVASGFIPVKINVLQQTKYADFYKVDRVPMDILVDYTGKELYRTTSPQKIDGYLAMLDQVRAQNGVMAGRTLEAMAQNQSQKFSSALPPMAGSPEETASSESFNADPRDATAPNQPWQSAPANESRKDLPPQSARMHNQYTTAESHTAPQHTEVSARHENPYVQGGDPADQATTPSPTSSSGRPLENSVVPGGYAANDPNNAGRANEVQATAPMPNMAANMSPPNSNTFVTGQSPAGQAPPTGEMVLPNNVPPLALDGFCPVTLVQLSKWSKGDPRFGAIHRDRTYLLCSQEAQHRFLAEADRFSPALSGYDPVRWKESGQLVPGKREHGLFLPNSGYYLFADEASLARFESQPNGYVNAVKQAMANSRPAPQR